MTSRIRETNSTDIPEILSQSAAIFGDEAPTQQTHQDYIDNHFSFVATDSQGNIIGNLLARVYYHTNSHRKNGWITSIYVVKEWRRYQIAKNLISVVCCLCKEMDYVGLYVKESNDGARKLYEMMGFHAHKILKNHYGVHENAIEYRKCS